MKKLTDYQNHFNSQLLLILTRFEGKRKGIIGKVILSKIFGLLTITMFLSIFMGFLNAFPFDEFEGGAFILIFQGFFYLILGIVVMVIVYKGLRYMLIVMGKKKLLNSGGNLYLYTFLITLLVLALAGFTGKLYLGTEIFGEGFFLKYLMGIVLVILFAVSGSFFGKYEKRFNQALKREILPPVLELIKPGLKYEPEAFIRQSDFIDSRLFPNRKIHRFKGSDFVTGSYGEGLFAFSQIEVQEISTRRSGGKTETRISELFRGLFYIADFNKSFSGKTVIYPDYARAALGGQFGEMLNQAIGTDHTELVMLEDTEFEKEFAVYSTNQVEARYILSPSMIERIKLIRQKLDRNLSFSFINNRVYIAISGETEFLTPVIFNELTRFESLEPIYYGIDALLHIAHDLQLNTRIWGEVK